MSDLFVGVTSWNSEVFLNLSLSAINRTCKGLDLELVVFDNCSTDNSVEVATQHGARVICRTDTQSNALGHLLNESTAKHTLLMHADVVLLNDRWFEKVTSCLDGNTIMVAPEDCGCGLMSRTTGKGHPESSFLFLDTQQVKKFRRWKVMQRRFMVPLRVERKLPLDGPHLTHDLAGLFATKGKKIHLMDVLYSRVTQQACYPEPTVEASNWLPALAHLEYGLGNFYAIDGMITHYHNWYERVDDHHYMSSAATTEPDNNGYPVEFVRAYTKRFIHDSHAGTINLPMPDQVSAESIIEQFSASSGK